MKKPQKAFPLVGTALRALGGGAQVLQEVPRPGSRCQLSGGTKSEGPGGLTGLYGPPTRKMGVSGMKEPPMANFLRRPEGGLRGA